MTDPDTDCDPDTDRGSESDYDYAYDYDHEFHYPIPLIIPYPVSFIRGSAALSRIRPELVEGPISRIRAEALCLVWA